MVGNMSDGTSHHPDPYKLLGANLEMVRIDTVRESNAQVKGLENYVAVFIGGMLNRLINVPSINH